MNPSRKLIAPAATAGTVVLMMAGPASAHVTVAGPGVTVGQSDADITFRVPTESDTASTTEVKVQLPTDTPLAGVQVVQQPGWTATVTRTKLAKPIHTDDGDINDVVSQIDWKADASAAIKPGAVGKLDIMVGKLPDDVKSLTFKAIQTYSDGGSVSWIDVAAAGQPAPDHPAPVLDLAAASSEAGASPTASPSHAPATAAKPAKDDDSEATVALVVGAAGVVIGLGGLGAGLRRRKA